MSRLSWPEYFMNMAHNAALRSTCPKAHVGAVIVGSRNRVIGTGYNGAPFGMPHCIDVGCVEVHQHCIRSVHAEVNAIIQAMSIANSINGATMYTTHMPCIECCKVIMNAGIKEVIYDIAYFDNRCRPLGCEDQARFLAVAGIDCTRVGAAGNV